VRAFCGRAPERVLGSPSPSANPPATPRQRHDPALVRSADA